MSSVVRRAGPLAALVVCALAVPAAHAQRGDVLVAQIAQATATPTPGGQPPLTGHPTVPLGTPEPTPTAAATATPTASSGPAAEPGRRLARTGSDAGLAALAGVTLLGLGVTLRRAVVDGAPV